VTAKKLTYPSIYSRAEIEKFGTRKWNPKDNSPGKFPTVQAFYNVFVEIINTQAGWQKGEIRDVEGEFSCVFYTRDITAVLQEAWDNPSIADKVVYAPSKVFDANGNRVFTGLHDTDWWWNVQVLTNCYSMLIPGKNRHNHPQDEQNLNAYRFSLRQSRFRVVLWLCSGVAIVHGARQRCRIRKI
jgi:hypothetical protein